MKLSVLMPVYNEKNTIEEIIRRVQAVELDKEIIIVDDGSTDGTRDILAKIDADNVKVVLQPENGGKGSAIREAMKHFTGDVALIQDADLEYDPREYPRLLEPILDGRADVVYGSRFLGGPHRVMFFWHYVGNKLLTTLSNVFTNLNLTDMETCYKVFRAEALEGIEIRSKRFGMEPEITAKMARKKCRIYEVPISYSGRDYAEGKKIGWRDGVAALFCILRYRWFD